MAPSCSQASEGLGSKHAEAHSLKRPGRAGQKRAIRGQRATQDMKRMEYGVPVSGRPLWFPLRRTGVAIPYQGPYKYVRRILSTSTLGTSSSKTCNAIRRCWDAAATELVRTLRSTEHKHKRESRAWKYGPHRIQGCCSSDTVARPPSAVVDWIVLQRNGRGAAHECTRTHTNTTDESMAGKHRLFMAETSSRAYR